MKEGNQPFNAQKALRVACLVLADLILINLSAFLALYIRFEFDLKLLCETEFLHNMIVYSGINSVCTILIFYILKLYNSLWEFAVCRSWCARPWAAFSRRCFTWSACSCCI